MDHVDVVVIGAGVVGLAIASELAKKNQDLYVIEKETAIGQGTSSRNSEVIHAGIYYAKDTLKAKLCVKANPMIYQICEKGKIPHKKLGKIIVGNGEDEIKQLEDLIRKGESNGVTDLKLIDSEEVKKLEPKVRADKAVLSPSTGILDAHSLMDYFLRDARSKMGADPLVLDTEVIGLKKIKDGFIINTLSGGEAYSLEASVVINSAGLFSDKIAERIGLNIDELGYRIHLCKGDYFSLTGKPPAKMLVYPPPLQDTLGLGIHTVPDLTGRLKFGPNAYYVNDIDYRVESTTEPFWKDIITYLPEIKRDDLHPDMSGIRPKLQGPGEPAKDFVIKHEEKSGFPGFFNLIGIESPGLTCSPAIAEMVAEMVNSYLY
ncbi:NAD(P)/FAD-dependent oxidoreductase [Candidatus Bathyarchaeota archaeon]|nr:NAD(P)/FAD-dependent oxidoreductase [Candidatus Bathyarchaeota archaeon]